MKGRTRLRMLADIGVVARAVSGRDTESWSPRAHFTMHRELRVGRTRVGLTVGIHVAPPGAGYSIYRAIVGLHPSRARGSKSGWHPALQRLNWYEQCAGLLRRYGYRGTWYRGPYGRFGDFERRIRTREGLLSELDALAELYSATWPCT
jgi:hypothetical protein